MKFPKLSFKKEKMTTPAEQTGRLSAVMRVLLVLMAASLVIAVITVSAPSVRKNSALEKTGEPIVEEMSLASALIAYYDSRVIATLNGDPANNENFLVFSDALSVLCDAGGYESAVFVVKNGKQFVCAGDSLFDAGVGAYSAGNLISPEKAEKNLLEKVFNGKAEGGVVTDVVTGRFGAACAAVLTPLADQNGEILGVLLIEEPVEGAPYHMVAGVNLYTAAAIFFGIALICGLLLYLSVRLAAKAGDGEDEGVFSAAAAVTEAEAKTAAERIDSDSGEVNAANVASVYPAPDFGKGESFDESADFDTPVIPSLTLPGEDETD